MNGIMKLSAAITCLALTGVAIGASTNGISLGNSVYATTPQSYSCGSLKFGMNDEDLKGDWSGNGKTWAPTESYVTVVEHTTHDRVFYSEGKALKFNNNSYCDGVISITFDYNIIQCTVYAAGWKGQSPILSVNGVEQTIEESLTVIGTSGTTKYEPYVYVLPTETNVLTLQANERLVIGDIALRATTQVIEPSSVASSEESTTIESSEESVETSEASQSQSNEIVDQFTSSSLNYSNQYKVTLIDRPYYTITFDKNGGNTDPAYYTNGVSIRLYNKNMMTIAPKDGYQLMSADFTFSQGPNWSQDGWVYTNSSTQTRISGFTITVQSF